MNIEYVFFCMGIVLFIIAKLRTKSITELFFLFFLVLIGLLITNIDLFLMIDDEPGNSLEYKLALCIRLFIRCCKNSVIITSIIATAKQFFYE